MMKAPRLSVVMPTYNCVTLLERHLEAVAQWADLADEIIVVDSHSTDGTLEVIRERLRHPKLRIIERDRGLYESWNEGIAATTGDWIYVSTAGDTIERGHLLHLLDIGERGRADVVISAPRFVDEGGKPHEDLSWPPAEVIVSSGHRQPFVLTAEAAFTVAALHYPCAILGSSASDLYRGDHLRARPFPVDFKGSGDSVWILHHAGQSRLCFTPRVGSTFCVHPKEDTCPAKQAVLREKLMEEKKRLLAGMTEGCKVAPLFMEEIRLREYFEDIHRRRRRLWHARPRTAAHLCSWVWLTMDYLGKRRLLKKARRHIQRKMDDACYLRLPAWIDSKPGS